MNSLKFVGALGLLCVGIIISIQAQSGPFGSDAVSEGDCEIATAQSLFNTNVIWLLNLDLGHWYTPVGSAHYYRDIFEAVQGRSANNQSELDAWNLNLTYAVNVETWHLYHKFALDVCLLIPGSPLTGIPVFHCALIVWGHSIFGVPTIANTITQKFTIVWTDSDSNMLTYRCQNGKRDWAYWTKFTPHVNSTVLNEIVLPKIKSLGFNMSNVEYMDYENFLL